MTTRTWDHSFACGIHEDLPCTCKEDPHAYYRLCDEALALGVPVSLDDPRSPKTVQGLREAVAKAKL